MQRTPRRPAFTLIELLVVITIIVVLLALLTPALDKAVYRAEQLTCAGQLKAYGTGLTQGAAERNRYYPTRLTRFQPIDVSQLDLASNTHRDERPALREYLGGLSLNTLLNCPLSKPVDIDNAQHDTLAQTSYALWHGWLTGAGEQVMRKIGESWSFQGDRYSILAQDYELGDATNYYNGQPDRDGVLLPYIVENSGAVGGWDKQTTSTWYASVQIPRGLYDMNIMYSDISVKQIQDVQAYQLGDERMDFVPNTHGAGTNVNNWQRVPKR